MPTLVYDWSARCDISDFHLEGNGEVRRTEAGELLLRTYHMGPARKATTVWLKHLKLPDNFRLAWRFRSESVAGYSMVIFNALPLLMESLFDDSRPDARISDLCGRKMVAYTCGFNRSTYNNPCVLRKIGGKVPEEWCNAPWESKLSDYSDQVMRLNSTKEPLISADKGKWHDFLLERQDNQIRFWVNGTPVQNVSDTGQYAYHTTPLGGGHLAFRNFGGPADDFYSQIRLETI